MVCRISISVVKSMDIFISDSDIQSTQTRHGSDLHHPTYALAESSLQASGSWYSFLLAPALTPWDIMRLEGLGKLKKNLMISQEIESPFFRLVA